MTIVMNTRTGALSEYAGLGATSCCVVGSRLLIATAEGVFALEGEGLLESRVRSGRLDLGGSALKTVHTVYLATVSGAPLTLRVSTGYGGRAGSFEYRLPRAKVSGIENRRIQLAKGVRARDWEFVIESKERLEFDACSALVSASARRI